MALPRGLELVAARHQPRVRTRAMSTALVMSRATMVLVLRPLGLLLRPPLRWLPGWLQLLGRQALGQ